MIKSKLCKIAIVLSSLAVLSGGVVTAHARDGGFHLVAQMAAGARVNRECDHATPHSARMRSAAWRGSGAAMIGRPTTR